jgi:hypothetical protein
MNSKRFTILTLVFAMMAMFAGAVVNAQGGDGQNGKRGGRRGFGGQSTVIQDATGLTRDELRTAVQNGSTVADLITANGGDVNSVIAELVAEATTHINEGVAEGRFTQEQADERLADLEEHITERLNGTFERPEGKGEGRNGRDNTIIQDATGLTRDELRTAVQNGSTVADLIIANGGDVDSVIAELVAEATTHINEQVAEGRFTQEQADERIADLEEHITDRLNGTFERSEGQGRRGRGFGNAPNDDTTNDT